MLEYLIYIACSIGWVMVLLPSIYYLFTEWSIRRDGWFGLLSIDALKSYYQRFFPSEDISRERDLKAHFRKHFTRLYGRRHCFLPLLLLAAVSGIGMWATARTVHAWLKPGTGIDPLPPIAISAFLGAYIWVLGDQLMRFRNYDFTDHDVYNCTYRFLIAIPFGFSFAAFAKAEIGIPLAFLLGAFPTRTLFKLARRLAVQKLGFGEQEEEGQTELVKLQGVGRANSERFQVEGVSTIVQLAWSDPIDLTIRTNFGFSYVVDCISQALLWLYIEGDIKKLYRLSLRGAQEVYNLLDELKTGKVKEKAAAQKIIKDAAAVLEMDQKSLTRTLMEVAEDPYTKFLCAIWK